MLVKTLTSVAKICSKISNQSSLTPLYRSIELGKDTIRCCSEFGNIELAVDPTGLADASLLLCVEVLAVASSLPQDAEITLDKKTNKVDWKCGNAKGHWNIVLSEHAIPALAHKSFPWTPDAKLADALRLASCACQAAAVSVGLYGISIVPVDDKLKLLSSNSISLAAAELPKGSYPTDTVTLRPPVPGIIAALIQSCPNCSLDVTPDGIFILGDWLAAHLPLGINLEHDLVKIADKFTAKTQVAKISSAAVKKFIARARVLTDRNSTFEVGLKIEAGKLALTHTGIASSTEEYFLAEGLDDKINYASVSMPADMLLLPLEFIEEAVFDYLPEKQLVLKGTNPEFLYVVSGGE